MEKLFFGQWKSGLLGYGKSGFTGHGKVTCYAAEKWLYGPPKSGLLGYGKSGFKGHGKVALLAAYKSMSEEATLFWLATPLFYQCVCSCFMDLNRACKRK